MRLRFLPTLVSVVVLAAFGVALGPSESSAQEASRYPYDPVCPWGRLSNGKGMLVRCISHTEAATLTKGGAPAPTGTPKPAPTATASPASTEVALAGLTVTPDEGTLPAAEKKLRLARDAYVTCVRNNGGLEKSSGEVRVRFLVRPRGRAEGVSVEKRLGLGAKAAECVANVIDRRWVGTPEAPLVGATAVVKFSRVKK
jgi:hypothetical protein